MSFKVTPQSIPDVLLIEHREFADDRGAFSETFRANAFAGIGLPEFVQDNQSRSAKGVVRGLHFQNNPYAIGKLVRCISGSIFDVAVDLRKASPTYGKWTGITLSASDSLMFYVPEGFAHGFMALEDNTIVAYKQTGYWNQETERSLLWNDPALAIAWPDQAPRLSPKDEIAPLLLQLDHNF
ncbi:dTDP-4-dehydrorhamnose 3,5-epimerase [Rhizobium sp. CG4]|uniref:dTDP-4-dehydrorhamnose 3,5-epimerase n=1 Tax=Rhizobium sp. CG4 TaxID=2726075 RepID=UPI002034637F|nr:dTDP-4-dehydrorhamnose 3,5-epimerase [Rhizobium sp. CG4]MCM2458011.1 dTDP-4-dehydrorhamnose 3,5-epimerase [Rhizobium sp. CG4]